MSNQTEQHYGIKGDFLTHFRTAELSSIINALTVYTENTDDGPHVDINFDTIEIYVGQFDAVVSHNIHYCLIYLEHTLPGHWTFCVFPATQHIVYIYNRTKPAFKSMDRICNFIPWNDKVFIDIKTLDNSSDNFISLKTMENGFCVETTFIHTTLHESNVDIKEKTLFSTLLYRLYSLLFYVTILIIIISVLLIYLA